MVQYLKIEVFAYDLFHTVWLKGGLISKKYDATEIYKDECLSDADFKEVCDKLFYDVVLFRRILFQKIYIEEITTGNEKYCDSLSDFYEYIHSTCNRDDFFGCLTVFERMFATCAFVLNLCFYNRKNVDIIKYGHICWAMYFDEFTEEFYEQGGWEQLKNVAYSYTLPLRFLQMCLNEPENTLTEVTEAIESYNNFRKTLIINGCATVSKRWVQTCIENLYKPSSNIMKFESSEKSLPTEYIIHELKHLCNSCALEVIQYDEECSERSVFDSDSFYLPLTPIPDQELSSRTNYFLLSSDETGEDALSASSSVEHFAEHDSDDSDFTNQSCFNELDDIASINLCDDIANDELDTFKQPPEFEIICANLKREQDHSLSRSMTKMHLNYDTLELEETKSSETDISIGTNDRCSLREDQVFNVTLDTIEQSETINKQCKMLEDLEEVVELPMYDHSVKVLSVTEGKPSQIFFEKGGIVHVKSFTNAVLSCNNKLIIPISEWNHEDLLKNTSTPSKTKTSGQIYA